MESIRRKFVSLISLGSNKVCVVSLTIFFIFLYYAYLNLFRKKNNLEKLKMLMTKISSILWRGLRQRAIRYIDLSSITCVIDNALIHTSREAKDEIERMGF